MKKLFLIISVAATMFVTNAAKAQCTDTVNCSKTQLSKSQIYGLWCGRIMPDNCGMWETWNSIFTYAKDSVAIPATSIHSLFYPNGDTAATAQSTHFYGLYDYTGGQHLYFQDASAVATFDETEMNIANSHAHSLQIGGSGLSSGFVINGGYGMMAANSTIQSASLLLETNGNLIQQTSFPGSIKDSSLDNTDIYSAGTYSNNSGIFNENARTSYNITSPNYTLQTSGIIALQSNTGSGALVEIEANDLILHSTLAGNVYLGANNAQVLTIYPNNTAAKVAGVGIGGLYLNITLAGDTVVKQVH